MKRKPKIFSLIIDENGNIVNQTFKVRKRKLYKLKLEVGRYDIRVEDEEVCVLNEDLSFKMLKNKQIKIFFTNKETKEFSYITLKPPVPIIPIFIPIILFSGYNVNSNTPTPTPPPIVDDYNEEQTTETSKEQGVIVFPSDISVIGVSKDNPVFSFSNSEHNRVFFHYYIFNPATGENIDIGQVAPSKKLDFDLSKYFSEGATNVRVDIRTYKDTSETKARNSMSFNSTVIIK